MDCSSLGHCGGIRMALSPLLPTLCHFSPFRQPFPTSASSSWLAGDLAIRAHRDSSCIGVTPRGHNGQAPSVPMRRGNFDLRGRSRSDKRSGRTINVSFALVPDGVKRLPYGERKGRFRNVSARIQPCFSPATNTLSDREVAEGGGTGNASTSIDTTFRVDARN